MAKKSKEPELSPEEKALIEKVDNMMDPRGTAVSKTAADVNESLAKELAGSKPEPEIPEPKPEPAEPVSEPEPVKPIAQNKLATAPELPGKAAPKPEPEAVETPQEAASPQDQPTTAEEESVDIDDAETDEAVDEIVSAEGDTMLAIEDAKVKRQKAAQREEKKSSHGFFWFLVLLVVLAAAGAAYYYAIPH